MIIAGGGSGEPSDAQANPGSDNEYPTGSIAPTQGLGYGGGDASGPGGGGWLSDGYDFGGMQSGGRGFKNSSQPLIGGYGNHGDGGFGGGSGGMDEYGTAGVGYTGGTGRDNSNITGGGGSYNSGTNQLNLAGANAGHGKLIISALNTPPSDITLSNHSLPENLPANSQVGTFSTTDPDDTNGTGNYIYSLVSGAGDSDNALFNLDANGTLTILATSDYEQRLIDSNTTALLHTDLNASFLEANYSADLYLTPQVQYPTWSIRVRTADDVNASYDEVILIASLDRDDTIPVITFDGNGTRTQTPWTYIPPPVYYASDNVDGNITQLVTTDGNLTT